jgi:hypothetical protein
MLPVPRRNQNAIEMFCNIVTQAGFMASRSFGERHLLKIAREIFKQAQEQVAEFQDEIDRMRKS